MNVLKHKDGYYAGEVISLAGFMGCGKSTVGRILAARLGVSFYDLDTLIEQAEGQTIPEIFASQGEKEFRRMEARALDAFLESVPAEGAVLSLGGGTLTTERCRQLLKGRSICIYLKASEDTLVRNLSGQAEGRPMLEGAQDENALRERIRSLMARRSSIYEAAATHTIQVDALSPDSIAASIVSLLPSSRRKYMSEKLRCGKTDDDSFF
ncbi:MAG: shikimate kinase [Candidatus Cryptobacteroides sp.]